MSGENTSRSCALGIDLGKEGWATLVGPDGRILRNDPTPLLADGSYDEAGLWNLIGNYAPLVGLAVLEEPVTLPGQQSASTGLTIGLGYGLWRMALRAREIPFETRAPREWKRAMGCDVAPPPKGKGREALIREKTGLSGAKELRARVATIKRRKKEGHELTDVELQMLKAHEETNDRSAERRKLAKAASVEAGQRLFPGVDWRASDRARAPHDGKVESALIALYALRRMRGQA